MATKQQQKVLVDKETEADRFKTYLSKTTDKVNQDFLSVELFQNFLKARAFLFTSVCLVLGTLEPACERLLVKYLLNRLMTPSIKVLSFTFY